MRLIVLDNGLRGEDSHHDHVARNLVRDGALCGCEVVVYGSVETTPELQAEVGVRPLFRSWFYNHLTDPRDAFARATDIGDDLMRSGQEVSAGDVILLPTASPTELLGVLRWIQKLKTPVHLAAIFHRSDKPPTPEPLRTDMWKFAGKTFASFPKQWLWLATTTELLRQELEPLLNKPMSVAPSVTWHPPLIGPELPRSDAFRAGFFGSLRKEKGSYFIPELSRRLIDADPEAQVVLQFYEQGIGADHYGDAYTSLAELPGIELVTHWLSDNDLTRLVRSVDVAVLPYDREVYAQNVSGVFALATGNGVPSVVPDGTWMADRIRSGAAQGEIYADETYPEVVAAILRVKARRDTLRPRAEQAARHWRDKHSGEAVLREIVGWARTRRPQAAVGELDYGRLFAKGGDLFERVINRVYSTVVRSGDVAVDGGAHKGLHTIPLARLVGSSGEVLAIEALPHLARALSESREVQALGNINVAALAVSEQAGRTTFHWVPEAEGYSGIRKRPYPDEVVPQLIEVDVSTIDTLLFGEKRPVSFIKLDLEGGEFFALRGACETLQTHRPVIVFEFGREATASEWGFSKDDFFDFFHQQRYETRDIFMREFDRDSWSKPETPWYLLGIPSELDHSGLTAVVDQFLRQQLDRS